MGVFKSDIPPYTGDNNTDIMSLRNWACRLVDELRHLFYDLDATNVKNVKGENIKGVIPIVAVPALPALRLKSGKENGLLFINDSGNVLARIYFTETDNSINISVEGEDGKVYINGNEIAIE